MKSLIVTLLAVIAFIGIAANQIGWHSGRAAGLEAGMCEVILSAAVPIRYGTPDRVVDADYCRTLFRRQPQ
jgi:hypothetical protein